MNWFDSLHKKVDLEYTLEESEDLEGILDNTNLNESYKDCLRNTAKDIITAEFLLKDNPLASEEDYQCLEDTKNKYQEVKDSLAKE